MNPNIEQNNNIIKTEVWREWEDAAKLCIYTIAFIYNIKLLNLDISIANKEEVTTRKQDIMIRLTNFNIIQATQTAEVTTNI